MDKPIVWMISVYAQKQDGFNITVGHWPLSREAVTVAEAKGLGYEWLEEYKPRSEGWSNYSVNPLPVYKEDEARLKAEGKAIS